MLIQFYYNQSDERTIFKNIAPGVSLNGALRDSSSMIEPVILIQSAAPIHYNYAYIPDFERYYFVSNVTSVRTGLWLVEMRVDVLMSFKNDIANYKIVIDKQTEMENSDEYIDDNSLVCNAIHFNRVYNFARGFNNAPEYILITAG